MIEGAVFAIRHTECGLKTVAWGEVFILTSLELWTPGQGYGPEPTCTAPYMTRRAARGIGVACLPGCRVKRSPGLRRVARRVVATSSARPAGLGLPSGPPRAGSAQRAGRIRMERSYGNQLWRTSWARPTWCRASVRSAGVRDGNRASDAKVMLKTAEN